MLMYLLLLCELLGWIGLWAPGFRVVQILQLCHSACALAAERWLVTHDHLLPILVLTLSTFHKVTGHRVHPWLRHLTRRGELLL